MGALKVGYFQICVHRWLSDVCSSKLVSLTSSLFLLVLVIWRGGEETEFTLSKLLSLKSGPRRVCFRESQVAKRDSPQLETSAEEDFRSNTFSKMEFIVLFVCIVLSRFERFRRYGFQMEAKRRPVPNSYEKELEYMRRSACSFCFFCTLLPICALYTHS